MDSSPSPSSPPWLVSYQALTAGCGVADLYSRSRVELAGADRMQFLHSYCTADIRRLSVGEGCESFLTNHQGKTVGYVYVRVQADALVLDTAPGQSGKIIQHLDRFVISDRVEFRDLTPATGELLVAGKDAPRLLAELGTGDLLAELWQHKFLSITGKRVVLQKVDYAGGDSYSLTTAAEDLPTVQQALTTAGAVFCEATAVEAARIEAGVPLFGTDITDENLPQEIGRDKQAISFTKGCYLGQETVARIDAMGHVNRLLVRVQFSSAEVPSSGLELSAAGKPIGKVTSATWSPQLGRPLALALLRRTSAAPGTKLDSPLGSAECLP